MSIEEMEKELIAAGYKINLTDFHVRYESSVTSPDGWVFMPNVEVEDMWEVSDNERIAVVEKAYAHWQREKQHEAMREYLIEVYEMIANRVGMELKLNPNTTVSFAAHLTTPQVRKLEEIVSNLKGKE